MVITTDLIAKVSKGLVDWLANHILNADIKMAENLRKFQCD